MTYINHNMSALAATAQSSVAAYLWSAPANQTHAPSFVEQPWCRLLVCATKKRRKQPEPA
ncbi:MAG: hypothetical protein U0074_02425 [Kouleothrix sp.]